METLNFDLYRPGMTLAHRVGLGGLVSTLMNWDKKDGWEVTPTTLTIRAENLKDFLIELYDFAFQLRPDGTIYFPGSHGARPPRPELGVVFTRAITAAIYKNKQAKKVKSKERVEVKIESDFSKIFGDSEDCKFRFLGYANFKHNEMVQSLFVKGKGDFVKTCTVKSTTVPGLEADDYKKDGSSVSQKPELAICLHFFTAGAICFGEAPPKKCKGVWKKPTILVLPEVEDLTEFPAIRLDMEWKSLGEKPVSFTDLYPASAEEAALRVKMRNDGRYVQAWEMGWLAWSEYALSVTKVIHLWDVDLQAADEAMSAFRLAFIQKPKSQGDTLEPRMSSQFRNLVLKNIAENKTWTTGFGRLCLTKSDFFNIVKYDNRGISRMINGESTPEDDKLFCQIVRQTMTGYKRKKSQFGIDFEQQREKWRVAFVRCRNHQDLQSEFSRFCARVTVNLMVRHWEKIVKAISDPIRWQHHLNLVLLSIASYPIDDPEPTKTQSTTNTESDESE